jgi:hypothetical protein
MEKVAIFLVVMILFGGCLGEKEVGYVCPGNNVVSDPRHCPEVEEKKEPEKLLLQNTFVLMEKLWMKQRNVKLKRKKS